MIIRRQNSILLPSRLNDHVVGNLSNNRNGVNNGKGCEESRNNNKDGKSRKVDLNKILRDEVQIFEEIEKNEVMLSGQNVDSMDSTSEIRSKDNGDKGIDNEADSTTATMPETPM